MNFLPHLCRTAVMLLSALAIISCGNSRHSDLDSSVRPSGSHSEEAPVSRIDNEYWTHMHESEHAAKAVTLDDDGPVHGPKYPFGFGNWREDTREPWHDHWRETWQGERSPEWRNDEGSFINWPED